MPTLESNNENLNNKENETTASELLKKEHVSEKIETPNTTNKKGSLKYVISAQELIQMNNKELPSLLKPLFPRTGLIALAGSSDTGKSSFLRQFAINLAIGANSF